MKIVVERTEYTDTYTIGDLYIDGVWFCNTLEDTDRLGRGEAKIKHETAIPEGTYKVIISLSNRFKKEMPLLLDVPGFDGIRIHSGNTDKHTSGCLLVGKKVNDRKGFIGQSLSTFNELMGKLKGQKDITIKIGKREILA